MSHAEVTGGSLPCWAGRRAASFYDETDRKIFDDMMRRHSLGEVRGEILPREVSLEWYAMERLVNGGRVAHYDDCIRYADMPEMRRHHERTL